jgi:hypothetical protein
MEAPNLNTLPDDAAIHILSKLTLGERCAASCVRLAWPGPAPVAAAAVAAAVCRRQRLTSPFAG